MKIIRPHARIMSELDQLSVPRRIETCGRICNRGAGQIIEGSAIPFVRNIIAQGHDYVLEMAVITLRVKVSPMKMDSLCDFIALERKYVVVNYDEHYNSVLVTGSMRVFRDLLVAHRDNDVVCAMAAYLSVSQPLFFSDMNLNLMSNRTLISVCKVSLSEVESKLSDSLIERHRFVAVKFVVNLAVSHELVRHRPCSYLQESLSYCRHEGSSRGSGDVGFIMPITIGAETSDYESWWAAMMTAETLYLSLLKNNSPQAARNVLPNSTKTELICFASLAQWRHILKFQTRDAADVAMREVMLPLVEEFENIFTNSFRSQEVVNDAA